MFRFFDFSPIIGEKIQINDIEAYATEVSTRRQVEIFKRNLMCLYYFQVTVTQTEQNSSIDKMEHQFICELYLCLYTLF